MTPTWRSRAALLCDILLLVMAALWIHSELTGGGQWRIGSLSFSNRGSERVLAQALMVFLTRRLLMRRPGTVANLGAVLRKLLNSPVRTRIDPVRPFHPGRPTVVIVVAVLVTRLLVFGAGLWATVNLPPTRDPLRDAALRQSQSAPIERLHGRWDAGWYSGIALIGYEWDPLKVGEKQNVAFFPAFPMLIRFTVPTAGRTVRALNLPTVLGRSPRVRAETFGALVSIVLFAVALIMLYRLFELDIGAAASTRAVILATVAPFSLFFSAPFTESLFLFGVVGSFLAQRTGRYGWLFMSGLLVGLTRQTGFLLALPLAYQAFRALRLEDRGRRWRIANVAGVLAPVIGAGVFCAYLAWKFGDPLAWVRAQSAWPPVGRYLHMMQLGSLTRFAGYYPYEAINLAAALIAIPLIIQSRRINPAYLLFGALTIAVPLILDVAPLGRLTAPIFPIYAVLALRVQRTWPFLAFAAALLILQMAAATQFYAWRFIY
jgi:hypothetical protein